MVWHRWFQPPPFLFLDATEVENVRKNAQGSDIARTVAATIVVALLVLTLPGALGQSSSGQGPLAVHPAWSCNPATAFCNNQSITAWFLYPRTTVSRANVALDNNTAWHAGLQFNVSKRTNCAGPGALLSQEDLILNANFVNDSTGATLFLGQWSGNGSSDPANVSALTASQISDAPGWGANAMRYGQPYVSYVVIGCRPVASGTWSWNYSNSLTIDIWPNLATTSISVNTAGPYTVGQVVNVTTNPSGGNPNCYHFHWRMDGALYTNQSQSANLVLTRSGSASLASNVTDCAAGWANASVTLSVSGATAAVTASRTSMDVGQQTALSLAVNGGVPPFTYQWTANSVVIGGNVSAISYAPTSTGKVWVNATATDRYGNVASAETNLTVSPSLAATLSSNANNVSTGSTVSFTATPTGGLGPYSYAWSLNGSAVANSASTYSFTTTGKAVYAFRVNVTDANAQNVARFLNLTDVGAYTPPTVSLSASRNTADVGQTIWVNATTQGGSAPFTYAWTPTGGTYNVVAPGEVTFVPTGTASVSLAIKVTDSRGTTAVSSLLFSVSPTPTLQGVAVTPPSTRPGSTISGNATVSGGATPFSYQWLLNGTQTVGSAASFTYVPHGAGTFTFALSVSDANGGAASSSPFSVLVSPNGSYLAPTAVSHELRTSFDVQQGDRLWVTVLNGQGPFVYVWGLGGLSAASVTGSMVNVSASVSAPTRFTWSVGVTDSQSNVARAWGNVTVYPSLTVAAFAVNSGTTLTITSTVSGGASPYTYLWHVNKATYLTTPNATASANGSVSWTLVVTDFNGASAWANGSWSPVASGGQTGLTMFQLLGIVVAVVVAALLVALFVVGPRFRHRRRPPIPPAQGEVGGEAAPAPTPGAGSATEEGTPIPPEDDDWDEAPKGQLPHLVPGRSQELPEDWEKAKRAQSMPRAPPPSTPHPKVVPTPVLQPAVAPGPPPAPMPSPEPYGQGRGVDIPPHAFDEGEPPLEPPPLDLGEGQPEEAQAAPSPEEQPTATAPPAQAPAAASETPQVPPRFHVSATGKTMATRLEGSLILVARSTSTPPPSTVHLPIASCNACGEKLYSSDDVKQHMDDSGHLGITQWKLPEQVLPQAGPEPPTDDLLPPGDHQYTDPAGNGICDFCGKEESHPTHAAPPAPAPPSPPPIYEDAGEPAATPASTPKRRPVGEPPSVPPSARTAAQDLAALRAAEAERRPVPGKVADSPKLTPSPTGSQNARRQRPDMFPPAAPSTAQVSAPKTNGKPAPPTKSAPPTPPALPPKTNGAATKGSIPTGDGTRVVVDRSIGPERTERNPYADAGITAKDVNPNVRPIDPKLLQPMELHAEQDRGESVRGAAPAYTAESADAKTRELRDKIAQARAKRATTTPANQEAPPPQE